jgi:Holliday junction resolvasome RuvABC endonuclease subunit
MSWPRNAGVVAKMGIVWGVIASIAKVHNLPMIQSSPMEIKRITTGDGKASKERMISTFQALYPDLVWPTQVALHEHCADALGSILSASGSVFFQWARQSKEPDDS